MVELEGMKRKDHVLEQCRLMVRAENSQQRTKLIKVIQVGLYDFMAIIPFKMCNTHFCGHSWWRRSSIFVSAT